MSNINRSTQASFILWVNGKPLFNPGAITSPPPKKLLVWGPGRSGTTAVVSILSSLGFELGQLAERSSVLENVHIVNALKSCDIDLAYELILNESDDFESFAIKAPILRAYPELLFKLSSHWGNIVLFRNPLSVALRNYGGTDDFAGYYKAAISESVRTEWTLRKLSSQHAFAISCNYDILCNDHACSIKEVAKLLGMVEPSSEFLNACLERLSNSFVKYNEVHPFCF